MMDGIFVISNMHQFNSFLGGVGAAEKRQNEEGSFKLKPQHGS